DRLSEPGAMSQSSDNPQVGLNTAAETTADPRLARVLEKLGDLVIEVPVLRNMLDLAIGAAASFMRAQQLGYKDRSFPLPNDYYEFLAARSKRMAKGTLPPHGLWISGYYFNSGILRLWSARDQLQRL